MKTLIIAGTYKQVEVKTEFGTRYNVRYNVGLFGQSVEHPLTVCIGFLNEELRSFDDLQDVCREMYCKYFNCDAFNIISMETLHEAK